jgi:hypothetical protein
MDLAVRNNERFIVDRRGEPAVVIMSVQDFIRTAAPPPDWLKVSVHARGGNWSAAVGASALEGGVAVWRGRSPNSGRD